MIHAPIILKDISVVFPGKICFEKVNKTIHPGDRIAIIGKNGNGKTALLNIIQGLLEPSQGRVIIPENVVFGYVPQVIEDHAHLSGGQRLNKALTQALAQNPSVLCLDEPTNHLDASNRKSLLRLLKNYTGTLIIISHDIELLRTYVDHIWHIHDGTIDFFTGNYDDYRAHEKAEHLAKIKQREFLKKEDRKNREALLAEHKRAAQSKRTNKNENDKILLRAMQESGARTTNKKQGKINKVHHKIEAELKEFRLPETITAKFNLPACTAHQQTLITIREGNCGYQKPVLENIILHVMSTERIALLGNNASGKSTLVKAIMHHRSVIREGAWQVPAQKDIGYLDQHNKNLDENTSVFDTIKEAAPTWTSPEIRKHLNDFLFRKNEEVEKLVKYLSGGEKTRLSLAQIAAQSPQLLILDEVTNCLDLETRQHVIDVLQCYPGALIVISHDADFLTAIGIDNFYKIKNGIMVRDNLK
ncbi:ABC-F family ATP-binding cassette domain-containing protein [bacterium]|nr:MAG: ABC-F family ATP-binding cassette domain-containing protein [bacterium]